VYVGQMLEALMGVCRALKTRMGVCRAPVRGSCVGRSRLLWGGYD